MKKHLALFPFLILAACSDDATSPLADSGVDQAQADYEF